MSHKSKVQELFSAMADEVFAFIKESESKFPGGWVPGAHIKAELGLVLPADFVDQSQTGWVAAALFRYLNDENKILREKKGNRLFFKTQAGK